MLSISKRVNLGVYYTPEWVVSVMHSMVDRVVGDKSGYVLLDTSCGEGVFFGGAFGYGAMIGGDVDFDSLEVARSVFPGVSFVLCDGLRNVSRENYGEVLLGSGLVIMGNPPYNDVTSQVNRGVKWGRFLCDSDLLCRDMGISFLRSYSKLGADYVCVLHPLSYLIKRSNFRLLKDFVSNYKLIDSVILSSSEFSDTSKGSSFPIIIGLYKRDGVGMVYDDVCLYNFRTVGGDVFSINDYVGISNFVKKYPNERGVGSSMAFYPLRDINALRRSSTFVDFNREGMVYFDEGLLPFYCYIDVFKRYIKDCPYYLCNLEVFINYLEFVKIKDCFIYSSWLRHSSLFAYEGEVPFDYEAKLDGYFSDLFKSKRGGGVINEVG